MRPESRLPTEEQIGVCPRCGTRVLVYVFVRPRDGAALELRWDPDARQRRWARSLMTARDAMTGPPWAPTMGRIHECHPSDLVDADADAEDVDLDVDLDVGAGADTRPADDCDQDKGQGQGQERKGGEA